MPKAKKKPATPVAPKPTPPEPKPAPPPPPPPGLKVLYHHLEITEYSITSAKGPLTVEDMKGILGWETEKEFQARKVAEEHAKGNLAAKPEHFLLSEGSYREKDGTSIPVHCKNVEGEKVVCLYNAHNRPFDMEWCEALIHTHLHGQWAGPHTLPGETVNGETVRVSRYGRMVSGQHSLSAGILADEWLQKERKQLGRAAADAKYPAWAKQDHVFVETIVITGMSEDPRVLMTVDYVKPRTAADVFYTSEVFKNATPPERKDLCRILASACDFLWTRTDTKGYRTHPEVVAFLERHKKLLKCVEHITAENSAKGGKKLSRLRLQPGVCAAVMYLQGSSGPETDGDVYRNEEPPSERNLDWSLWDRAEEFWTLLAGGKDFQPVRTALGNLLDSTPQNEENQGLGGRGPEKLSLLAKAWDRWREHTGTNPVFTDDDLISGGDLCLSYSTLDDRGNVLPEGQVKLLDVADFSGIDCPESVGRGSTSKAEPMPPPPSREEIERLSQEALARRKGGK